MECSIFRTMQEPCFGLISLALILFFFNFRSDKEYVLPLGCFDPNSKPYDCGRCGKSFADLRGIRAHYKHFHSQHTKEAQEMKAVKQQCRACLSIFQFGLGDLARHRKTCKGVPRNDKGVFSNTNLINRYARILGQPDTPKPPV